MEDSKSCKSPNDDVVRTTYNTGYVIASYANKETEKIAAGVRVKKFEAIARSAQKKLTILRAAARLDDLMTLPGNRLEALEGDRRDSTASGLTISTGSASNGRTGTLTMSRSLPTTSRKSRASRDLLPLITPGEILREEFMEPLELSANALAQALHVPANRIQAILHGTRGITADTALRLSQYFGNSAEFWLNLQQLYELDLAKRASLAEIVRSVSRREAGKVPGAALRRGPLSADRVKATP
jgi:addiction module HigA family antidote